MEGRYPKYVAMLLVVATVVSVGHGQCGMSQVGFSACRPAVTNTNNGAPLPAPSKDCCEAVEGANLRCLCTFANSPLLTTFNINKDAAMSLPVACNVDPNFHC